LKKEWLFLDKEIMMRVEKLKRIFCFIFSLGLLQSCAAQEKTALPQNADENSLLWEISSPGFKKPSYLFGSFHVMCKEDISISNNLKLALERSDELYFEMDMDDPSNTLGALFFMNMKDGKSLKDLYSQTEYERLAGFFADSLKTPLTLIHKMKPAFLEALLYPKLMPCKKLSGIEEEVMRLAKPGKKEIRGFETIAFQAGVFDSIPYEIQARSLLKSIDSINEYKVFFNQMLTLYKSQELSKIEKLFNDEDFGMQGSRDVLLDKRNQNWVQQMKSLIPGKSLFITVGAGHLVGRNGLIELLKREGYTLRPLLNK